MRLEELEKKIYRLTNNEECCNNESLRSDLCDKKKQYEHLHGEIVRGIIFELKLIGLQKVNVKSEKFLIRKKGIFSKKVFPGFKRQMDQLQILKIFSRKKGCFTLIYMHIVINNIFLVNSFKKKCFT